MKSPMCKLHKERHAYQVDDFWGRVFEPAFLAQPCHPVVESPSLEEGLVFAARPQRRRGEEGVGGHPLALLRQVDPTHGGHVVDVIVAVAACSTTNTFGLTTVSSSKPPAHSKRFQTSKTRFLHTPAAKFGQTNWKLF